MSSSFGKKKHIPNLQRKYPELFNVTPRAGGYRRELSKVSEVQSSFLEELSAESTSSCNLKRSDLCLDNFFHNTVQCPGKEKTHKEVNKDDMIKICSIAISTVMLMAQQSYENITIEHVKHVEEYFRGLKMDEEYPYNISKILQILSNLKKSGIIETKDDESSTEDSYEDDYNISVSDFLDIS